MPSSAGATGSKAAPAAATPARSGWRPPSTPCSAPPPALPGQAEGEETWLLTGRLSLKTHPWLADHRAHGSAILPGTGFVEMALKAADQCGAEGIEELTLAAPLVLPEQGAVQVQVSVGTADEEGHRPLAIHFRADSSNT